jgi:nitrate reductase assembly molybdenum cofactor insertion protein NarJ
MDVAFDLRLAAPLVKQPTPAYHAQLERARLAAGSHVDASRDFGRFAERLKDLAVDELEELYRETFAPADRGALADAAALFESAGPTGAATAALPVFERLLPSLAADRNPFTLLFKALCCLLIARSAAARPSVLIHQAFFQE